MIIPNLVWNRAPKKAEAALPVAVQVPPELLRSSPREVQLSAAGRLALVVAFLLVIASPILGVLLFEQARRDAEHATLLSHEAATTTARVTELGRVKDGRRLVRYTFAAGDHSYTGSVRLRREAAGQLKIGSPLAVKYLPLDPSENWFSSRDLDGVPFFLGPLIAVITAGVATILWFNLRRQKHLLANGRPAVARVSRLGTKTKSGITAVLEYRLLSGAVAHGKLVVDKKIEPETQFVVLYDPEQPQRVVRYPLSLIRTRRPGD